MKTLEQILGTEFTEQDFELMEKIFDEEMSSN